ncbi:hypothetical protein [Yinghuangia soli]|nr:hypothetical protein [Yinghuangia soli]
MDDETGQKTRTPLRMTVGTWDTPVKLIFEPWATEVDLEPHMTVTMEWDNNDQDPQVEVVHHPESIQFFALVLPRVWDKHGNEVDI